MTAYYVSYFFAALVVSWIFIRLLIPYMTKLKFGQTVRADGPQTHLKKTGTPTMGGLGFIFGITLVTIFMIFVNQNAIEGLPVVIAMWAFGFIGFIDDYLKVVKKSPDGLKAKQKLALQILVSMGLIVYILIAVGTEILIPFTGGFLLDLGWLYIPFVLIVILGTTNGVNLTDGVDGLATIVTIIVAIYFTIAEWVFQGDLMGISLGVTGGLLAFLWFNRHPAKIFMGDTGSLALGGYVVAIALLERNPLIILLVGFIYLIENISVIIQVSYYKKTKKRIFLMAPLHHHYEKKGFSEIQVVGMFGGITFLMSVIAYLAIMN